MLLKQWIRAFRRSGAGTVTDLSLALGDNSNTTTLDLAADEYLYVAQYYPFNNIYFDLETPNTATSSVTVEIWDGSTWNPVVDTLDGTDSSGAFLGQDGVLQYTPDRDYTWSSVENSEEENTSFLLQNDVTLYDLHWMRLSVSDALDGGTAVRAIDYKFATDEMLTDIDPEINRYLTSWETGKTDWERQLRLASQHVIQKLKVRGLVVHPGQILLNDDVSWATAYRCLEIIYSRLGEGYEFQRDEARRSAEMFMNQKRFTFDLNQDGQVDAGEINASSAEGIR